MEGIENLKERIEKRERQKEMIQEKINKLKEELVEEEEKIKSKRSHHEQLSTSHIETIENQHST